MSDTTDLDPTLEALEQRVAATPDDADAWRELAEELVATGEEVRAIAALKRFLELVPGDSDALSDLAHLEHRAGRGAEAVDLLGKAVETSQFPKSLLRNLIDLHLERGQNESALSRAEQLSEADGDDVIALLDIAELALGMADFNKASRSFERLGRVDDADGHLVYALHGVIEAEVGAQRWRAALNAAIDAAAADRHEFTTDLLLFVSAQLFGVSDDARTPKPWPELAAQLAQERAEHRRYHIEQSIL
jgi:tetratricopeptide (TPR) repeat protein